MSVALPGKFHEEMRLEEGLKVATDWLTGPEVKETADVKQMSM